MYSDRIKGNSPELVFELGKTEATSIIMTSIRHLSSETSENTEKMKYQELLDAYEKTNRSHEEILRFMLGS